MDIRQPLDALDEKDHTVVHVTLDWSMKFIDHRHHHHKDKPEFYALTTIFQDKIKQDGITTAAVTFSNIKAYLQSHPEVSRIVITSDNAGAYKSGTFIQSHLWNNTQLEGARIECVKYSEPESGKSVCDRYGGLQKMAAKEVVRAGFNIRSDKELAFAVTGNDGVANCITVLATKKNMDESMEVDDEDSSLEISGPSKIKASPSITPLSLERAMWWHESKALLGQGNKWCLSH